MKRKKERPSLVRNCVSAKTALAADLADDNGMVSLAARTSTSEAWNSPALRPKWLRSLQVTEDLAVTRDLGTLISAAGADLPDDFTIEHHQLFTEHGWVYFETPLKDEIHEYPIRALTWHHGTGVTRRFGDDQLVAGLEVNLWSEVQNRTSIGVRGPALIPAGADFLPYGMPTSGWADVDGVRRPDVMLSRATRFVLTLQTFLRDELPASVSWPVPRSLKGQVERADLPLTGITVIDLRKRAARPHFDNESDEAAWHLRNRHVVRGHWAKRWVGPTHPHHSKRSDEKELTHVYIAPYLKGPEDAPIAMTEKVNLVRR